MPVELHKSLSPDRNQLWCKIGVIQWQSKPYDGKDPVCGMGVNSSYIILIQDSTLPPLAFCYIPAGPSPVNGLNIIHFQGESDISKFTVSGMQ